MREASTDPGSIAPAPAGPRARRVQLRPLRRLTRGHLALLARPQVVADGQALLALVAEHLGRILGCPVALEARLADAALQPLGQLQARGAFAVLELAGDALALLELDPVCVGALLARAAGGSASQPTLGGLTRIEEAALGWLVLSCLGALRLRPEHQPRWLPRLVALHAAPGPALERLDGRRRHLAVLVTARLDGQAGLARLLLPAGWLKAHLASVPEAPPGPPAPEVAAAELALEARVGAMAVARPAIEALAPGDVLVFPELACAGGRLLGPGRLRGPALVAEGRFTEAGFLLTRASGRLTQEHTVSQVDPAAAVEVEIELTRLRVPLHRLGTLQAGAVLLLHLDAAQTVVLRVGDRPVARAELVEVEGEIGARVLQLLSRPT